jgi:hypothetical protein
MPVQRDRDMHKAGLRVPPYYARTATEAEAVLQGMKHMSASYSKNVWSVFICVP